jgi:hypothetical protein
MYKKPVGRPLKFKSPEEMQEKIDAYYAECELTCRPLTMSGLAYALDTSRESLVEYAEKDQFVDTIKTAKQRIMRYAEEQLYRKEQVAGVIFSMKNNFGFVDKTEQEVSGTGVNININRPKE